MLSFCQRFIMKIQSDNIGHKTRLRNRFVNEGMENFEPHEVLEVMLYKSFPYSDTNALAHRLIDRFGSFAAVLEAPYTELEKVEGMGRSSAITLSMWREFFRYYERSKRIGRNELCTVDRLPQIASALLKGSVTEEMHVLCLDVKSRLLGTVKISQNSPTFVSATVREIVERAFGFNAAGRCGLPFPPVGQRAAKLGGRAFHGKPACRLQTAGHGAVRPRYCVGGGYFQFQKKRSIGPD